MERSDDKEKHFRYELTPVPTSLFKDNFMRNPNKSALADYLLSSNAVGVPKRKASSKTSRAVAERLRQVLRNQVLHNLKVAGSKPMLGTLVN